MPNAPYYPALDEIQVRLSVLNLGENDFTRGCNVYKQYYHGTQYTHLPRPTELNKDVGVREKQPRVVIGLPKTIIDRSAGFLFGKMPNLITKNEAAQKSLDHAFKLNRMGAKMLAAAKTGGQSGGIYLVLSYRPNTRRQLFIDAYCHEYVKPYWVAGTTDELEWVRIQYQYPDAQDATKWWWYRRDVFADKEITYDPQPVGLMAVPDFGPGTTNPNPWGFLPVQYCRNLEELDNPFGVSDLAGLLDIFDELNYSYSGDGRALEYNSDPQMWLAGAGGSQNVDKAPGTAWELGNADAKIGFLEMEGTAQTHTRLLREDLRKAVIEVSRIIVNDPEKIAGKAQSGYALMILHQALIELTNEKRTNYGEHGLKPFAAMVLEAIERSGITWPGLTIDREAEDGQGNKKTESVQVKPTDISGAYDIDLDWPDYFPPSEEDKTARVGWITALRNAGLLTERRAVELLNDLIQVSDVDSYLAQLDEEREAKAEQFNAQVNAGMNGLPPDKRAKIAAAIPVAEPKTEDEPNGNGGGS